MEAAKHIVAIVGAGPYGLAAAAHLRAAGVDIHVFGEPMAYWEQHMPAGMCLRSSWEASTIADPHHAWTLDRYQDWRGTRLERPLPLADFIAYGRWFQQQAVPDLDRRRVIWVEPQGRDFRLVLDNGEVVSAQRVVIATGLDLFVHRPSVFEKLPAELVSHISEHRDLSRLAGKRVVVIGGGQSAVESAVLLSEHGADVEIIARAPRIRWLTRTSLFHRVGPIRRLLYARTDVGPIGYSRIVALPDLFRRLPRAWQDSIAARSIRPAAAAWLRPRFGKVRLTSGGSVVAAQASGNQVLLELDNGSSRTCDHVVLATGYRIDVARYPFLSPALKDAVHQINGYPQLGVGLESSVPGLHFLGAPAAMSFGPIMRFVSGTEYAARTLTQRVLSSLQVRSA